MKGINRGNYYKKTAALIGKFCVTGIAVAIIIMFTAMLTMIPFGGPVLAGWLFAVGLTQHRKKSTNLMEASLKDIFWVLLSFGMIMVYIISILEYVFVITFLSMFSGLIVWLLSAVQSASTTPGSENSNAYDGMILFFGAYVFMIILYVIIQLVILLSAGLFFTNRKYKNSTFSGISALGAKF